MKRKMNNMTKTKRRAMNKGEIRMMGIMKMHHHIHEYATTFKGITPPTIYLVILRKG
jgi:hypothetical protein